MDRKLLIAGAGTYALVAYEIACDMGVFCRIDFVDDTKLLAPTGEPVVGKTADLSTLAKEYTDGIVAIGNPDVRLKLLDRMRSEATLKVASLISPKAYVAPSAVIGEGTVEEPFAVIHTKCCIERGCLISAGAVVGHESVCGEAVHVDCNATVPGYCAVAAKSKVPCGTVYRSESDK